MRPALLALTLLLLAQPAVAQRTDRWAKAMAAFAAQDEARPPAPGRVVFVGSSSIRLWDVPESFPEIDPPPLNRGFGGSQISDSIQHFDLLVGKHRPRLIVMYAGDNDIAAKKSPERVHADFLRFAELVREKLPEARLAYISIKPSLSRWALAPEMQEANAAIAASCAEDDRLTFLDIWRPMLGDDGRPRPELFLDDGLHMNKDGYAVWAGVMADVVNPPRAEQ